MFKNLFQAELRNLSMQRNNFQPEASTAIELPLRRTLVQNIYMLQ